MKSIFLIIFVCVSPIWSRSNGGARLIGGQSVYAGEFPYAAAITATKEDGNYFCTGSLLSDDYVLTAAHCIDGSTSILVLLGTHKLDGDDLNVERVTTDSYVLHPEYNPATLGNDIGLIKFAGPVMFNTYIRNLRLPDEEVVDDDTRGVAFGWGQISDDDTSLSNTLQSVTLYAVSDSDCRATYGDQIVENMVCFAGAANEGTCYGDGGSPIIQHDRRGFTVIIAVAAFFSGNGCETTDPSGYTRVFPYIDWINEVTGMLA